ncbi:MAG: MarR family transcriptional regulator [Pseudomonadota bacterium]
MTEADLPVALMSELLSADQTMKSVIAKHLPRGLELSHFSVLNHLSAGGERSPAQLARSFQVTKGAMTNTLRRLNDAGFVHIRPDWDDSRKKMVSISPAGRQMRDYALQMLAPVFDQVRQDMEPERLRDALRLLRAFRAALT